MSNIIITLILLIIAATVVIVYVLNYKPRKHRSNIKELYSEGYHILHELSLRYNKQWIKNPSIHNKEIVIDYPLPHDREKDRYYDFFL